MDEALVLCSTVRSEEPQLPLEVHLLSLHLVKQPNGEGGRCQAVSRVCCWCDVNLLFSKLTVVLISALLAMGRSRMCVFI